MTSETAWPRTVIDSLQPFGELEEWLAQTGATVALSLNHESAVVLLRADERGLAHKRCHVGETCFGLTRSSPSHWWAASQRSLREFANDGTEGRAIEIKEGVAARDLFVLADGDVAFLDTMGARVKTAGGRELWRPSFVPADARPDFCHLSGLAADGNCLRYVSAFTHGGYWRHGYINRGVVVDVETGEAAANGLTAPHSPRIRDGALWVLNSGDCALAVVVDGKAEPVVRCPGFARGLDFFGDYAAIGLSVARGDQAEALQRHGLEPFSGVAIADLERGEIIGGAMLAVGHIYGTAILQ